MSNRNELRNARRDLERAQATLALIEALPRRKGSLVQWGENGVIWRRIGDDQWEPLHRSDNYIPQPEFGTYPSAHVAVTWQGWRQITSLPALTDKENNRG
jgi:hypothetical protein